MTNPHPGQPTPSVDEPVALKPCPFCGKPLGVKRGKINPMARCTTEGCIINEKMSVVNLDDPVDVERWNTRALAPSLADELKSVTGAGSDYDELLKRADRYNARTPADGRGTELLVMELADALRGLAALRQSPAIGGARDRKRKECPSCGSTSDAHSITCRAALATPQEPER